MKYNVIWINLRFCIIEVNIEMLLLNYIFGCVIKLKYFLVINKCCMLYIVVLIYSIKYSYIVLWIFDYILYFNL